VPVEKIGGEWVTRTMGCHGCRPRRRPSEWRINADVLGRVLQRA